MNKFLKWLALSFALFFAACNRSPNVPPADEDIVAYLSDDEGFENDESNEVTARIAANAGKICFEYLNNETEIFRPATYTIRLWQVDETADPSYAYLSSLGDDRYDHPTYVIVKPNNKRSYTRKTVKAGWYLAEFDGSGKFFKFNVTSGSDGLLIYNEHNFNSLFQGYFSSYGKLKVGWKKAPGQDANAVLVFQGAIETNVWIYAEDGTGTAKGQFWFMPVGSYQLTYTIGTARTVTVNVAAGKTYPYIKMTS